MRPILYGDIVAAASVIRCVDPDARRTFLDQMMDRAHCADKFRKRLGLLCPGFGDGTLAATCAGRPRQTGGYFSDPDYADCMRNVFEAILTWKSLQRIRGGAATSSPGFCARKAEC